VLDGVSTGMYDALLPLVLADVMGGTARYGLARAVLGHNPGHWQFDGLGATAS